MRFRLFPNKQTAINLGNAERDVQSSSIALLDWDNPIARAYDGEVINGEVEDYQGEYGTLAVTPSYFLAEQQGDMVDFNWQTATETATAGLILLAVVDGGLIPLNSELIPSPETKEVTDSGCERIHRGHKFLSSRGPDVPAKQQISVPLNSVLPPVFRQRRPHRSLAALSFCR